MTVHGAGPVRFAADVAFHEGEPVLVLRGELDLWTQPQFAAALAGFAEHYAPITLDLSDVDFIDVGNIGLIHQARALARGRGSDLVLRSSNPRLSRILELTGLGTSSSNGEDQTLIVLPVPSRVYERSPLRLQASL